MQEEVFLMRQETEHLDVIMGEPIGVGNGKITASECPQDRLEYLKKKVPEHRVDVSSDAPLCCIDGRCGLHTLAGRGTEPRPSLAGGPVTAYAAAELVGLLGDQEGTPAERFVRVVELLEAAGIRVGNHIDQGAEETLDDNGELTGQKTGCGANDHLVENVGHIYTEREAVLSFAALLMGGEYDERYADFADGSSLQTHLSDWNPVAATNILAKRDADSIEVLESDKNSPTGGHAELFVVFNYDEDTTIDRDAYFKDTGEQIFVVDMWMIDKIANALAVGPEAEDMRNRLRHGMVAYQLGTYLTLCDGSQRPVIVKEKEPVEA